MGETQVELAVAGVVTPEMMSVAKGEGLDADQVRARVAEGTDRFAGKWKRQDERGRDRHGVADQNQCIDRHLNGHRGLGCGNPEGPSGRSRWCGHADGVVRRR